MGKDIEIPANEHVEAAHRAFLPGGQFGCGNHQRVQTDVTLPRPIGLSPAEAQKFRDLKSRQIAFSQWTQTIVQMSEKRGAELVQEGQALFDKIGREYKLDMERVSWELSQDGNSIVPKAMKL